MNNIDISYENINHRFNDKIIVKICNNILELLKVGNWEISIVFSDDVFIRELNRDYRNRDEATDVLSFPQIDGAAIPTMDSCRMSEENGSSQDQSSEGFISLKGTAHLSDKEEAFPDLQGNPFMKDCSSFYAGDIIISLDTVVKNSEYFNVDKNEELIRLLIHGILHLYGMTHENNEPDQIMLIKQEELLKAVTGAIIF